MLDFGGNLILDYFTCRHWLNNLLLLWLHSLQLCLFLTVGYMSLACFLRELFLAVWAKDTCKFGCPLDQTFVSATTLFYCLL